MRSATAVLASLLVASGVSALSERSLLLHEKRDAHPESFVSQGPAASDAPLRLRIALVQADIDGLKDKLMDVSTPGNAAYGQHLSKDEVGTPLFVNKKPRSDRCCSSSSHTPLRSPRRSMLFRNGYRRTDSNLLKLLRLATGSASRQPSNRRTPFLMLTSRHSLTARLETLSSVHSRTPSRPR